MCNSLQLLMAPASKQETAHFALARYLPFIWYLPHILLIFPLPPLIGLLDFWPVCILHCMENLVLVIHALVVQYRSSSFWDFHSTQHHYQLRYYYVKKWVANPIPYLVTLNICLRYWSSDVSKITQGWLVGVLGNRELVGETEMKCHFIYKVSICLQTRWCI